MLHQCALPLAPDVHYCHLLGGHLEHFAGSLHRVVMTPPRVIAVIVDIAALTIIVVVLTYLLADYQFCFIICSSRNVEWR